MGAVANKGVYPVCNSCSQRKVGSTLLTLPKGAPSPDWPVEGVSPRSIAQASASQGAARRGLEVADPAEWSQLRGLQFTIPAADIPQATGSFLILQGSPPVPALSVVLLQQGHGPRRLLVCPPLRAASPEDEQAAALALARSALASCAPEGSRERGSELHVFGKDGRLWGAVVSKSDGSYSLFRDKQTLVVTFQEDQRSGRLMAYAQDELVAVARPSPDGDVEVGVKPDVDPFLILTCVFGVLIFDIGPAVLPIPVL
eukprot:CAMPEP_0204600600 /NCGR_PEP_ID=MMETSP0661-20131031/55538_1 /ASSEMBLY_ACC=CAM_ASM_000606 /TAXON_ID=109239 /ORGANISM="Alexandrium margalefi, Strain AMGDE01CS-322" /LENGTH=256 /DNA_ID=CAMNT_0051611417 /DNA_START=48 /DNA_END=821 /DNA_ORIENTATION=+